MKSIDFDMDCKHSGDKKIRVHAENFVSAAELVTYCKGRECVSGMEDNDFFNGRTPDNKRWYDFKSSEDLIALVENGVSNTEVIKDAIRYARTAQVKDEEKLTRRVMDVVGGGVDVPAYLTGIPTCMYGLKRQKVKSRIVKLCIYCKALSHIDVAEYKKAGELIAKTVAKLEKAGYRIRLLAMDAYEDRNWQSRSEPKYGNRHGIWIVTHMIKRENEPMNYRRVLFPLTRMAYHRGLGFGWMAVNGAPEIWGLGGSIEGVVTDDNERDEMFAKACGADDYIIMSQTDVIGYIQRYGEEQAQKMVDAKVMSLE